MTQLCQIKFIGDLRTIGKPRPGLVCRRLRDRSHTCLRQIASREHLKHSPTKRYLYSNKTEWSIQASIADRTRDHSYQISQSHGAPSTYRNFLLRLQTKWRCWRNSSSIRFNGRATTWTLCVCVFGWAARTHTRAHTRASANTTEPLPAVLLHITYQGLACHHRTKSHVTIYYPYYIRYTLLTTLLNLYVSPSISYINKELLWLKWQKGNYDNGMTNRYKQLLVA